jgi:hypothetical protein
MLLGVLRLRRFSDAPLALLIGTPAKRVKEKGAPSLKHPFARVFPALRHFAAGELKVVQWCGAFHRHMQTPRSDQSDCYD